MSTAVCFESGDLVPARPIGAACAFDGDGAFGLFVLTGGWLYGVDGTGVASGLFDFGAHWPFEPAISGVQVVESRGEYVGAAVAVTPKGDPNPKQAAIQILLADAKGKVLFHSVRTAPYANFVDLRVHGDAHGVFAFSHQTAKGNVFELVGLTGQHFGPVADAVPIADPDRDGRIAIRRGQDHFWLDPCRDSEELVLGERIGEYTAIEAMGSKLAWVNPSTPEAALETADGAQQLSLPLDPTVQLFRTHPAGWALAASNPSPSSFASANVAGGTVLPIDVALPPSLFRFGSFGQGAIGFDSTTSELGLASDGSILLGMRDASVGRLYRSFDGASWSPVGFPVGKVWRLVALERAGTLLIAGAPFGFTPDDWDAPPPDVNRIDYQQMQLFRPELDQGVVLAQATLGTGFTRRYSLSSDGGCAGTLLDDHLEITSAITLEKTVITLPTFTPVYGAFTFVPGPTASLGMN